MEVNGARSKATDESVHLTGGKDSKAVIRAYTLQREGQQRNDGLEVYHQCTSLKVRPSPYQACPKAAEHHSVVGVTIRNKETGK